MAEAHNLTQVLIGVVVLAVFGLLKVWIAYLRDKNLEIPSSCTDCEYCKEMQTKDNVWCKLTNDEVGLLWAIHHRMDSCPYNRRKDGIEE